MTITAADLIKSYGPHPALRGVDLEVADGETYVLLGPNGAGKTTTIEILEGYRKADGGVVSVQGLDPARDSRQLRPLIGVMLQEGGLYLGLRVKEALRQFGAFYREPIRISEIEEMLDLGTLGNRRVRELSSGETRRLSLALALIGRPRVAFLDEPTAQMDPRARSEAHSIIEGLKRDGVTVLLTTHLLEEAEALADRIGILHLGRMVAEGTIPELTASAEEVTFVTDRGVAPEELAPRLGVEVTAAGVNRYRLGASPWPGLIAALARELATRGVVMTEMSAGRRSLSEVYLAATRGEVD
jgi:ABC-2 type transport system ATP-binding protein